MKEVRHLDESKSSPLESIPARVLKDIVDVFVPKMVIDFNAAIKTGVFPSSSKAADVVPLFKKGDRLSKNNYRHCSLLSAISKIFGRLMLPQIHGYLQNVLSIFLCGYECAKLSALYG